MRRLEMGAKTRDNQEGSREVNIPLDTREGGLMGVALQGTENKEVTIENERVAQKGKHRQGGT
jgi:hypothetical protein